MSLLRRRKGSQKKEKRASSYLVEVKHPSRRERARRRVGWLIVGGCCAMRSGLVVRNGWDDEGRPRNVGQWVVGVAVGCG